MTLLELFCHVDDFTQNFDQQRSQQPALPTATRTRDRALQMQPSEIMTLLILFHQQRYRNFKAFYVQHAALHLRSEFPRLPSYNRFVEWMPRCIMPLTAYLFAQLGSCSGISFLGLPLFCGLGQSQAARLFSNSAGLINSRLECNLFLILNTHLTGRIAADCRKPPSTRTRLPASRVSPHALFANPVPA